MSEHKSCSYEPHTTPPTSHKGAAGKPSRTSFCGNSTKVSPARLAALDVVCTVRQRLAFAQDVIRKYIDSAPLSLEDRAFATKLSLGVISTTGTLDDILNRALNSPSDITSKVRDALQISTYEIIFLDKTAYAAVDQGVELVRSFAPKAAGLANAVLRKVVVLRASFPFGDPLRDRCALARMYAFPVWLANKLISEMGFRDAVEFMRASNDVAPIFVAVNTIKTTPQDVLLAFTGAQQHIEPMSIEGGCACGRAYNCMRVPDGRSLLAPSIKREFSQGNILVSDAASQMVAALILPEQKPSSFLEIGAGRATKTILLQSAAQCLWGSQIEGYVTLDNHAFKTNLLKNRTKHYNVKVSEALTGNACMLDEVLPDRYFDMVFIDAPCSGLGTLRRHPEIRWRIHADDIEAFAQTQRAMLAAAARHVGPGATLAYATCTVTREENIETIKAFLSSEVGQEFRLEPIAGHACFATQLTPSSPDAHFAVRLKRIS